ncbi:MAG: pantetheine-phosphate adenylyltransferase [Candidatus Omnitrophota bacterium]
MKKIAVYPGSFDPVTYGHLDIVKRALKIFDKVIVAVAHNTEKDPLFDVSERIEFLKRSLKGLKGVEVDDFNSLVVDYVKKKKAALVVRGLRMISDFEYEFQMALTNRKLSNDIETIFMMSSESYSYLSSKLIKEAAGLGANLKDFDLICPVISRTVSSPSARFRVSSNNLAL